jgi:hypothetical protein
MKTVIITPFMILTVLISFQCCAPARYVKPLAKKEQAASFSFGGPLIGFAGASIPIPFTTLAYGRGLTERFTLYGGLHLTSLAFGNLQADLGGTYDVWHNEKNGISGGISLQTAVAPGKSQTARLWPVAELNYYFQPGKKPSYLYAGLNAWFEMASKKSYGQEQPRHLIPNLQLGYTIVKEKNQHQFEIKYLGIGIPNVPGVVDYRGLGGKGSFGIYYCIARKF